MHKKQKETIKPEELHQWSDFLVGRRIRLISMKWDPDPIDPGTTGTIDYIDHVGTVFVKWDNGRSLGVAYGVDEWEFLK